VHPNYASKHEWEHASKLNAGVVIETNSSQQCYTTNSLMGFVIRELGRKVGVPIQKFVVRNGNKESTIGSPVCSDAHSETGAGGRKTLL
jgi:aspartyl aminopeptidase